jgi:plasmid maintenance system killer protein
LATLHAAPTVAHMDLPAYRLHPLRPLRGRMKGFWAVAVRANWRVIFRFAEGPTPRMLIMSITTRRLPLNKENEP